MKSRKEQPLANTSGSLFVHFDKNIYTNNEQILFSAYILAADSIVVKIANTLSVALIRESDKKIIVEGKFVIVGGRAMGSIIIPDTAVSGKYRLSAVANVIGNDNLAALHFVQPVMIRSTASNAIDVQLKVIENAVAKDTASNVSVVLTVKPRDQGEVKNGLSYTVRYCLDNGPFKTREVNGAVSLRLDIPKADITGKKGELFVEVEYQKRVTYHSININEQLKDVLVRFYPEGGVLSEGMLNRVGWEARTSTGRPVDQEGQLIEDVKVVDTISSGPYGIGKFNLIPQKNSKYYFRPFKNEYISGLRDIPLPLAQPGVPVLSIANAIVTDSVNVQIRTENIMDLKLVLHDQHTVLLDVPIVTTAKGSNIKIGLADIPKGIYQITLMDSVGLRIAERSIFAHFDFNEQLSVKTDKEVYRPGEFVTIKIGLPKFNDGRFRQGTFSVACVQANRLITDLQQTITDHFYWEGKGVTNDDDRSEASSKKAKLEDMLLVKGWTRYDIDRTPKIIDTFSYRSMVFSGNVLRSGKLIDKPAVLTLLAGNSVELISTDQQGLFFISPDRLYTEKGRKARLAFNKGERYGSEIQLLDPFLKRHSDNNMFANDIWRSSSTLKLNNAADQILTGFKRTTMLSNVTIKGNLDRSLYDSKGKLILRMNPCGDYVCVSNILNCPRHFQDMSNRAPVAGHGYRPSEYTHKTELYEGCSTDRIPKASKFIEGVSVTRESYEDYLEEFKYGPGGRYFSTIYWNAELIIDKGEAMVQVHTNDITGAFYIVVQGVADNDVYYKRAGFEVQPVK